MLKDDERICFASLDDGVVIVSVGSIGFFLPIGGGRMLLGVGDELLFGGDLDRTMGNGKGNQITFISVLHFIQMVVSS